jgi:hypothetical protein
MIGDHGTPGPEVSAAALAAIDGTLGTLPPQPVTSRSWHPLMM